MEATPRELVVTGLVLVIVEDGGERKIPGTATLVAVEVYILEPEVAAWDPWDGFIGVDLAHAL